MGIVLENAWVPSEAVEKMVEGSYEAIVEHVAEVVSTSFKRFLSENADEATAVWPVATFRKYVLVATGEGKFFRAQYEIKQGKAGISVVESMDVPVVTADKLSSFVDEEFDKAIEFFFDGDMNSAAEKVRSLFEYVNSDTESVMDQAIGLKSAFEAMEWLSYVQGNKDLVEELAGDEEGYDVKFTNLISDVTDGNTLKEYAEQVEKDVGVILFDVREILRDAEACFEEYKDTEKKIRTDKEQAIITRFESFATGFLIETKRLLMKACEIVEGTDCVTCHAVVYDNFARIYNSLRSAGSLVEYFSRELVA